MTVAERMRKYRAKRAAGRAIARALQLGVRVMDLRRMLEAPLVITGGRNADRRYTGTRARGGRVTLRPVTID